MGQRKAVTQKLATAYRRGSRTEKARILGELCELTGWHRDHARKMRYGGASPASVVASKASVRQPGSGGSLQSQSH